MWSKLYAKFRGSSAFLWTLVATISIWLSWNSIPFLPHFAWLGVEQLNVFLSVEASMSVAILIMANEKTDRVQKQQLESLLNLVEAIKEMYERDLQSTTGSDHRSSDEESGGTGS